MIFVTNEELRQHLELDNLNPGVIEEAFSQINNHEQGHYLFTNTDEYKDRALEYATKQGWNLDTTLVLFEMPPTPEEKMAMEASAKPIEDWDDIQIGYVDPKQIILSFYQNITLEKMAQTINAMGRLKVFL